MELIDIKNVNNLISMVVEMTIDAMSNRKIQRNCKIPKEIGDHIANCINRVRELSNKPYYLAFRELLYNNSIKIPYFMVQDFVKTMKEEYNLNVEGGAFDQDGQWLYIK